MSTSTCKPGAARRLPRAAELLHPIALVLLLACGAATALDGDRNQPMEITADFQKTRLAGAQEAGITELRGNVQMVQGSLRIRAARALVHQHPGEARDAQGNDVSGNVARVVLSGNPAHLEERQQAGGALVSADAAEIDYDADSGLALLTGNVRVEQAGRGEFMGERMRYNTRTGEIESGAEGSGGRVRLLIQPKVKTPPAPTGGKAADS